MKRSYLALAIAGAALAISASGPAYAQPADDTVAPIAAAPEAMPAANAADINRVTAFAPAPRLTYAVLVTTTSPQALALGSYRTSWSIA